MPLPLVFAAAAPYGNTFAVMGGQITEDLVFSNSLYLYNPELERFEDVDGVVLQTARISAVAMSVRADSFPQCRA